MTQIILYTALFIASLFSGAFFWHALEDHWLWFPVVTVHVLATAISALTAMTSAAMHYERRKETLRQQKIHSNPV